MSRSKKGYSEKMRNPLWQRKRLEVFERDGFACRFCKSKDDELQVHHLVYEWGVEPWETDLDDLITLCKECHKNCEDTIKHVRCKIQSPGSLWTFSSVLNVIESGAKLDVALVCVQFRDNPEWWKNVVKEAKSLYKKHLQEIKDKPV